MEEVAPKTSWWNKITIRNKLKFTIVGFSLFTLIIITLTVSFLAYSYFTKKTQRDLTILANVFAENVRAAVTFNDDNAATNILSALAKNPRISTAVIFKDNEAFAVYPDKTTMTASDIGNKTGIWFSNDKYHMVVPIIVGNQIMGKLLLVSDLKDWQFIKENLYLFFFTTLIGLLGLTTLISLWLEKQITTPLRDISDWAVEITKTNSFKERAIKKNDDEIGNLVDSLNTMLSALLKQESIITLNKKLVQEIKVRENAEKELIVMRDKADAANQSKSLFLANMSHEIRTPLNGVIGMIALLERTKLDVAQIDYLATIKQSSEILLTLINEILDFSKIEAGHLKLEISDFDLRVLLDEIMEILAPLAHAKGLSIGAIVASDIPVFISGDAARLRQIIMNLISNAIKFTNEGGVELTVKMDRTKTLSNPSVEVLLRFEVNDTGIGISPENRKNLFKVFSQGDNSTSRKYGGTGLGLVISKRLVEQMGGEMDVVNRSPQGSTFWFTIRSIVSQKNKSKENTLVYNLSGLRVLAVDDNSTNLHIIKKQTESWSMDCDVVSNRYDAIAKLQVGVSISKPYRFCLIDYSMPTMGKLIDEIQKIPEIKDTTIIMMTPVGKNLSTEDLAKLNVASTITKPILQSTLLNTFLSLLNDQQINEPITINNETEMKDENVSFRSESILLAEDNLINQKVALQSLEFLQYRADVANNGLEVLNTLQNKPYDIVLMDCQMPEMDGYTATKAIRKLEEGTDKHLIIIAMTANALDEERKKCIEAGMDDYISKPFDLIQLEKMLEKWVLVLHEKKPEKVE